MNISADKMHYILCKKTEAMQKGFALIMEQLA